MRVNKKGVFMTRKFSFNNLRNKLITILTVALLICAVAFGLVACEDEKPNSVTDPSYSKTETTTEIANPNFYAGTPNVKLTDLPLSSPKGWGKASADNSASASSVNSGVIVTSDEGWKAVLSKLYDDTDFLKYLRNKFNFTDEDVVNAIKAEKENDAYSPTADEKKEYITKTYLANFANPGTHTGAEDDAIYMLNNIATSSNYLLGTAQKISSTSTVTVKKGEVYKVSVWVKTLNLTSFANDDFGANIRIKNTINSKAQANLRVSNIIANDWTEYSIYVKADGDYTCTFSIILGLGYGNGSSIASDYVEGTAFFDDVKVEKVESAPAITSTNLVYGSEDELEAELTNNVALSDMSLANSTASFCTQNADLPNPDNAFFTKSNTTGANGDPITSKTLNPDSKGEVKVENGITTVTVDKASITLPLTSADFKLGNEEYLILSFYYQNKLNQLGSTNFSLDVIDKNGSIEKIRTNSATFSITEDDNWEKAILLFKNNFPLTIYI